MSSVAAINTTTIVFVFVLKVHQTISRIRSVAQKNANVHANSLHQKECLAMCTASAPAMKITSAKHLFFITRCSPPNKNNAWPTTFPDMWRPPHHSSKNALSRISLKSAPNWEAASLKTSNSRPQPISKRLSTVSSLSNKTKTYIKINSLHTESMQKIIQVKINVDEGKFYTLIMFLLLFLCLLCNPTCWVIE